MAKAGTPPSASDSDYASLVVGVGASAGGLEALLELLRGLGPEPGMTIVLVQPSDQASESLLPELLVRATTMSVVELDSGRTQLDVNTVYVCPPHSLPDISCDSTVVLHVDDNRRRVCSIDHFFHAIAECQGERGVGVILSGAGSGGTLGLKAISDRGGLTFAQDARSAADDSMPRSAATTGVADHVLPPAEIAEELLRYVQHLVEVSELTSAGLLRNQIEEAVPAIVETLLAATSHNFQHYKVNTLVRRIQRRMQIQRTSSAGEYVDFIQQHDAERQALFRELLIGVTTFFRDPEAFETLARDVLPQLFQQRTQDDCVRIWVAGCANGAEAYTIAILCREYLDGFSDSGAGDGSLADLPDDRRPSTDKRPAVQIFATDIDERALSVARTGIYPAGIAEHISPERLKRFFVKRGQQYQVIQDVRELVLFSAHNLISDPPFSRQDLISCRNLLIYLESHLQNKLMPLFHFALRPSGYLFLGPSENINSHAELFRPIDAKLRISQRNGTAPGAVSAMTPRQTPMSRVTATCSPPETPPSDLTAIAQDILLDEFAPQYVIVDESGQILNSSANVGKYLQFSGGDFQNNIIRMVAVSLRVGLRAAFADAKKRRRRAQYDNLSFREGDRTQRVMLTVQPVPRRENEELLLMVVFHDVGLPVDREDAEVLSAERQDVESIIAQMERELQTTRSDLDRTMQDMEAANEELQSANEELLSLNEELQSANEELESSKEEIRSSSDAIAQAHADMENLLRSTQIATVFLNDELQIRSFTPAITEIYGLISTDIGRPLELFVPLVEEMPPLPRPEELCAERPVEQTVVEKSGKSFIRRVLPYQSPAGKSDGIVVTFTDISELQRSREYFQLLVNASAQIVWITAADGTVLEDSPSWRNFTGQSLSEWLGSEWIKMVHPDDRKSTMAAWTAAVNGGETFSTEYRLKRSTGEYVWMQVRAAAQRQRDGRIDRWVGMNTDITDRKRRELDIADREAHLRRVIDNTLNFIGVLDAEGTLLEANATAIAAGGVRREDVVGRKFWECYWWNFDKQSVDQLRQSIRRAVSGEVVRYDVTVRMAGDTRMVIDFMLAPVLDDAGNVAFLIPSGTDISERIAAERTLIANEQRLRMAMKAGGMAAWEWTPEGSIWTDELYELIGLSGDETACPETFFSVVHPDDVELLKQAWTSVTGGEKQYNHEFRIIGSDGEIRWIFGVGEMIHDDDGNVQRVLGLNWDNTKEHAAAEQLRKSEQAAHAANASKSEFLANMSHEIRTPMTAVLGYTDLLENREDDPEKLEHLRTIRRNGNFLLDIINDILDLSKIEAGRMEIVTERFAPHETVEDVRSLMGVRAVEKDLDFQVEYNGPIPATIESDSKRLRQILVNLIGNAIKFTESGSVKLVVRYVAPDAAETPAGRPSNEQHGRRIGQEAMSRQQSAQLRFDVIDTGIGMTKEQQRKLFQPFSQGDASVTRSFGGTGLGLAISQRLVQMLHGRVTMNSTYRRGSTVSFHIDAGDLTGVELIDPPAAEEGSPEPDPLLKESAGIRLTCHALLVDDRRDVRFLAKHILTQAGATVMEAEDGELAIAAVERAEAIGQAFDLVLLDMQMPNLDGYATARRLRALGFKQPIIALTADAMHGDMNRCLECGCNDYLSKPIDASRLLHIVQQFTRK